jgi:peptidoglycan/LPS O-acetylase OafA/YrhL
MCEAESHTTLSPVSEPAKQHVPALDGVRGLAIIFVLLVHLTPDSHVRGARLLEWIYKFAWAGWIGVDLFFVLSGFLITGILLKTQEEPEYLTNFYMRRTLRIFPLYFGVLFLVFVILAHSPAAEWLGIQTIARHQLWFWLYATNFGMALHFPGRVGFCDSRFIILSPFWSLAVEEHFYLVWPWIVRASSTRNLKRVCWLLIVSSLLLRIAAVAVHPGWLNFRYFILLTPLRIDALAAGSLLAIVTRQHGRPTFFVRQRLWIWLVCGAALVLITLRKKGLWQSDPFIATIGVSIIACFAAATLVLALFAPKNGWMHKIWTHPALKFMGKYSYGMYVYHSFLQAPLAWIVPAAALGRWLHQPELGDLAFVILCTMATVVMAYVSYRVYEEPFLSLKRYFQSPVNSASAPARTIETRG